MPIYETHVNIAIDRDDIKFKTNEEESDFRELYRKFIIGLTVELDDLFRKEGCGYSFSLISDQINFNIEKEVGCILMYNYGLCRNLLKIGGEYEKLILESAEKFLKNNY